MKNVDWESLTLLVYISKYEKNQLKALFCPFYRKQLSLRKYLNASYLDHACTRVLSKFVWQDVSKLTRAQLQYFKSNCKDCRLQHNLGLQIHIPLDYSIKFDESLWSYQRRCTPFIQPELQHLKAVSCLMSSRGYVTNWQSNQLTFISLARSR